ncbi:MAG: AsmA-like C-terminal region-containing protein, partial [Pseudohongiellaceae bacterium]
QLILLAVLLLILFAAFLSIGRQFIPAVSNYKTQVEGWLFDITGVPIAIDSLTGRFEGFNPVLEVTGLRLLVPIEDDPASDALPEPEVALEFDHATLIFNVGRSLLLRRWELENFVVERMEASAVQAQNGEWQLRGVGSAGPVLGLDDIYRTLLQVSRLELRDLTVNLSGASGVTTKLQNGLAIIQNRGDEHFFHINANRESDREQILLSMEVTGSDLQQVNGRIHLRVPEADYSDVLAGMELGDTRLDQMAGGGNIWLDLDNGQLNGVTVVGDINRIALTPDQSEQVVVEALSARTMWTRTRDSGAWTLTINGLEFTWQQRQWPDSDYFLNYSGDNALLLHAQQLDLGLASDLSASLGLTAATLQQQLSSYQPLGRLSNISLYYPLQADTENDFELTANLHDVALGSVRNSPTMSGVSGYLQAAYDFQQQQVHGRVEVASENLSINIPSVFVDNWQYDQVNGALDFQVDIGETRRVHLVSGVIHARSDIVDGHVQFESDLVTYNDGRQRSAFSLLVGARDVKGNQKTPYLPSAPNLKSPLLNTMKWLDAALIDASVSQAGVIYRGSVLPTAVEAEKTFHSFYDFSNAHLRYQEIWPDLTALDGRILVRDKEADIAVRSGITAAMDLGETRGTIRSLNGNELWLEVEGEVQGQLQAAVNFLAAAPLNLGLDQIIDGWQATGEVTAGLRLKVPLSVPLTAPLPQTHVEVAARLEQNDLLIPDLQLQFSGLTGNINYTTGLGLHDSAMRAHFFAAPAQISLQSIASDTGGMKNTVSVIGVADSAVLAAWPRQSEFVRNLLGLSEGTVNYQARLNLPGGNEGVSLVIDSDLQGVRVNLPQPLGKSATQRRPLHIEMGIGPGPQPLSINLGADLTGRMLLQDGNVVAGVVYLGTVPGIADPWTPSREKPGMEVRGNLDNFVVSEWLDLLENYAGQESPAAAFRDSIATVNLDVGTLDLFGQQLPLINVEIQHLDRTEFWSVGLNSDAVAGTVLIPFAEDEYIEAYLAYLRLPGSDSAGQAAAETAIAEPEDELLPRIDPLAMLDPRRFPRLKFHTGSFQIGERDYGLGQFTLDPTMEGAEFTDLAGNFRGLQLGLPGNEPPRFRWQYDGSQHHSYLTGIVTARDLADVLSNNGYAASLESSSARFDASLDWPGSPAYFSAAGLSGQVQLAVRDGRFLQRGGGSGALKLISILNFDAIMRRARFSDDLLRRGLAYDDITGDLTLQNGIVTINDRLIISGPSSVYQITGQLDLVQQTINGEMYLTLPLSDNIPWLGLLTANIPLAIGAYLFERIFGEQMDNLTSAQYTLIGPWEGLEPQFKEAFGSPKSATTAAPAIPPAL